jgi:hypothetical protein
MSDFLKIFFTNIYVSTISIESVLEDNNSILAITYQTKYSIVTKLLIWDYQSNTYKETGDLNTNNTICKAIVKRYGVTSFTNPYFTGTVNSNGQYEIKLYGYKKTDMSCCPSLVINLNYEVQANQLVPIGASGIYYSGGTMDEVPEKNNFIDIGNDITIDLISKMVE